MKTIRFITFLGIIVMALSSRAVEEKKIPVNEKETSSKMEHSFEDLLVQGKYHFSDEAVTTVEEDKVLDGLLGVRTDFKDRIEQSVGNY